MPTREQVEKLLGEDRDYERAGRALGIPAGQAYLIATGLPADGSDTLTSEERRRPEGERVAPGSTQGLASGPAENPTTKESVERWLVHRASLDWQMRAAAKDRDAAPGEFRDPDHTRDLHTVLTRDHNNVTAMVEQLDTIPGVRKGGSPAQLQRRKSIVDMITVALSRHESVEEEWFWPVVRRSFADGHLLAEQGLAQEQDGKEVLVALGRLAPDADEFDELVERLVLLLRRHVAFEDYVLLRVSGELSGPRRQLLGRKLRYGEKLAPTRPHAHAPKQPSAAVKLAGLPAAVFDRIRDRAAARPADRRGTSR